MKLWTSNEDYGQKIPNLTIDGKDAPYGVVNEQAVRAGAGIMFALGTFAFYSAVLGGNFAPVSVIVPLIWLDFALKVFIGPKASYVSYLAGKIAKRKKPEFVGAIQKRFAWTIGLALSSVVGMLLFAFDVRGLWPASLCGICLVFMWLETSVGICVGCKIYGWLLKNKIIPEPKVHPVCPDGACEIRADK